MDSHAAITSLPVGGAERTALIAAANSAFEAVLDRIEPANEALTRSLWDADHYIDHDFGRYEIPMKVDYAVYLIEAFLVHHVIDLAVEADRLAANPPVVS
jgi:hypothetical protein